MTFNVLVNGAVRQVELCGIIDRMDIVSDPTINDGAETLRIVDYKTNGSMEQALSMDALFTPGEKHPHYVLQTFLYALMVAPDVNNMPLMPTLFLSINMVTRIFCHTSSMPTNRLRISPLLPKISSSASKNS